MSPELYIVVTTALGYGVLHTAVGVDHWLPFIVLGKARQWSLSKTLGVTAACGVVHVLSSVLVGSLGWLLGISLSSLELFEAGRGSWAAWLLIVFGFTYAAFSFWRMRSGEGHRHVHVHADGTIHSHSHAHEERDGRVFHRHDHESSEPLANKRVIPALLIIFLLGPCEALIPLMMAPGLDNDIYGSALVALAFGGTTLLTMVGLVMLGYFGLNFNSLRRFEPHLNWVAGLAIGLSGLGVQFVGL